jgi:hypothetical protein
LLGGYPDIDTKPWPLLEWTKAHRVQPKWVPWEVEAAETASSTGRARPLRTQ